MPYKDKEKQKEYLSMYYLKNKDRYRDVKKEAIKKWRLNNKLRVSLYNAKYSIFKEWY